ncbi:MAG: hypothetical protein AWU54_2249 [Candidatus Frackibacter sp. T328-2]|nr:MAG: hypothetical protein AWU54_2249 [Candidatus Frackibacter sp. T328-2]
MKLNVNNLKKLIDKEFDGNIAAFARAIGVNRSTAFKAIESESAGNLFAGHLISFCDNKDINFRKYIFLPNMVKKVNQPTDMEIAESA